MSLSWFECKGQELIGNAVYNEQSARKRVRSTRIPFHEGSEEEVNLSQREHFRITVFLQTIDSILAAMQKRLMRIQVFEISSPSYTI